MSNRFYKGPEAPTYSVESMRVANGQISDRLTDSFDCTISYFNGLNDAVTIVERNGLSMTLPPQRCRNNIDFVIRVTYQVPKSINFDSSNLLSSSSDITLEMKTLSIAVEAVAKADQYNRYYQVSIDYVISREVLTRRGGSIYLLERDLVVSMHFGNRVPLHPFSTMGQKLKLIEQNEAINNPDVFGMSIRIVDNNGVYGDRFININNRIYRIPARRNNELPDGVYFVASGVVHGDYDLCPPDSNRYNFDVADKALSLYKSVEEAVTLGDVIKAKEREIEDIKLLNKQMENKHSVDLLNIKMEHHERAVKLKEKEFIIEEQKMELEFIRKREDHARHINKLERSDASELLKYVPALLAGIGAAIVAYKKLKDG